MKQISYLKSPAWHRCLMLIGLVVACCGQVLADDKVTYSSDVHPTQIYSLKSFYDIDGDGILEVVGGTDRVGYSEQNAPIVSKTNGTLVKIINTENLAEKWFNNLVCTIILLDLIFLKKIMGISGCGIMLRLSNFRQCLPIVLI